MLTKPPVLNLQGEEDEVGNNANSCSDHSAPGLMCKGLSSSGLARGGIQNSTHLLLSSQKRSEKKKSPKSVRSMPCARPEPALLKQCRSSASDVDKSSSANASSSLGVKSSSGAESSKRRSSSMPASSREDAFRGDRLNMSAEDLSQLMLDDPELEPDIPPMEATIIANNLRLEQLEEQLFFNYYRSVEMQEQLEYNEVLRSN